jgi:hypothetical protein
MYERKGQVNATRLVRKIGFLGYLGKLCHFFGGVAHDLTHFAYTHGNLFKLAEIRLICLISHNQNSFQKQKTASRKTP